MGMAGAQGEFIPPFLVQAVNLLPKSLNRVIGLEKLPEIPVPHYYPWEYCCVSL